MARNVINALMVVALLVTSAISGSTSTSLRCSFYQQMRSERQDFVISRQSSSVPGNAIVGNIRELWEHFNIAAVQRMPYSQSCASCLSLFVDLTSETKTLDARVSSLSEGDTMHNTSAALKLCCLMFLPGDTTSKYTPLCRCD